LGAACADTSKKGPEIRTKNLRPNATVDGKRSWFLERGDKFVFHTDETIEGDNTHVAVTYANFAKVRSLCVC
jgi:pyruvate kinase